MADQPNIHGDSPPPTSPRRSSMSLQAAAAMNASIHSEASRRSSTIGSAAPRPRHSPSSGRRRSVLMNLQVNDPNVPAPGEMVTENQNSTSQNSTNGAGPPSPRNITASPMLLPREPHHSRTPSLGELHQELEEEQEAQVNRLLHMIRQQQLQLQQLQAAQGNTGTPTADDNSATSDRSTTQASQAVSSQAVSSQSGLPLPSGSISHSPRNRLPRSSFDMARADLSRRSRTPSRGPSQGASPRLRAASISIGELGEGIMPFTGRDESAFYQAETQMLVRENQMLKHRVKDLEKQLAEAQGTPPTTTCEPSNPSQLALSSSAEGGGRSSPKHDSGQS